MEATQSGNALKPPPCINCEMTEHMVLESQTIEKVIWHCRYCSTKTGKVTDYGQVKPVAILAGILGTALHVGIQLVNEFANKNPGKSKLSSTPPKITPNRGGLDDIFKKLKF